MVPCVPRGFTVSLARSNDCPETSQPSSPVLNASFAPSTSPEKSHDFSATSEHACVQKRTHRSKNATKLCDYVVGARSGGLGPRLRDRRARRPTPAHEYVLLGFFHVPDDGQQRRRDRDLATRAGRRRPSVDSATLTYCAALAVILVFVDHLLVPPAAWNLESGAFLPHGSES